MMKQSGKCHLKDCNFKVSFNFYPFFHFSLDFFSEPLGEGYFGKVLKAKMTKDETKTTVAVKTLHSNPERSAVENLMSELKIMIHLGSHPNIVNVLGACTTKLPKQELYVMVEYCEHGNIVDVLRKHKQAFR